ncbi:DNA-(apurinic or apyrimidinic site) lyase 2 [Wickerhamiella sorbophila]|uniref:DNA-(apurinic or apyrimidinic site) endonuclease n=1 Tax=Wickerhamiella sorbophila TaxID=45607 RepID=A0A2T0FL90_9ASCO|nr:DNA-(apurinic or apyrimidinic site) lyase 2 [Wickerhamiella sorbophila]PRT55745.1 DNA-(apurinic or apyrimidinic site) lyase 2 [Wickerhamiella sorbophila]
MDVCRRRFLTFNVCGINNLKKVEPWKSLGDLRSMFDFLEADVICFQETKLQSKDLSKDHAIVLGFHSYFSFSRERKGYSGVVIYVRDNISVVQAEEGLTGWLGCGLGTYKDLVPSIGGYPTVTRAKGVEIDSEGRVVVLDLVDLVIIGAYCPANASGNRTEYRDEFFELLDQRIRNLMSMGRNILLFGDINVTRDLIDSAELIVKSKGPHATEVMEPWTNSLPRKIINELIDSGLVDTTRERYKDQRGIYTHWNQMLNSRPSNFGNRLDYILVSSSIECVDADIIPELLGSDHCPVYADLVLSNRKVWEIPALADKTLRRFKTADLNAHFKSLSDTPPARTPETAPLVQEPAKSPKKRVAQHTITALFGHPPPKAKRDDRNAKVVVREASIEKVQPASQDQWKSIFTRKVPKCLHNQDCKLLVSKKPGRNKGRAFWVCQRPYGEPDNPEARCNFFKWANN